MTRSSRAPAVGSHAKQCQLTDSPHTPRRHEPTLHWGIHDGIHRKRGDVGRHGVELASICRRHRRTQAFFFFVGFFFAAGTFLRAAFFVPRRI